VLGTLVLSWFEVCRGGGSGGECEVGSGGGGRRWGVSVSDILRANNGGRLSLQLTADVTSPAGALSGRQGAVP